MSTNHEYTPVTPYIENGWLVEPCEPDYAPGVSQPIPGTWAKPIVNLTELDGWDELVAAAEQRVAAAVLDVLDTYPAPTKEADPTGYTTARLAQLEHRIREAITDAMEADDD